MKKVWYFIGLIAVLGLWSCADFNYRNAKYFCDPTHHCAAGWGCNLGTHTCVPLSELPDTGQETVQDVQAGDLAEPDRGCIPSCGERECGDDGCGGSCGQCGTGKICKQGKCVENSNCGDGYCANDEDCGSCPQDCACAVGTVCYQARCCVPGAVDCVKAGGEDWDGDGVPNQWELQHCKNKECKDYAITHSEVFPEGYTLSHGIQIKHPFAEPCCPLSLKDGNKVPCQCDLNCDGKVQWCYQQDQDGDGYSAAGGDCNDQDPTIHPGAPEKCGDGIDQDCKDGDLPCDGLIDADHDGWDRTVDCNDNDPHVHPGAKELCNSVDDDCNGYIDDTNPGVNQEFCHDWHGKTYPEGTTCVPGLNVCLHVPGKQTATACMGDIPPVKETCDHLDDDCDGKTDEDFDLSKDPKNCGDCGVVCENPHGTTTCKDGHCVPICEKGFGDCDWNTNNGCESDLNVVQECGTCDLNTPCPEGFFCNKNRVCQKLYVVGQPCSDAKQCKSGFCADGQCCQEACDGPCRACQDGVCIKQADHSIPEKPGACNGALCGPDGLCMKECLASSDCEDGFLCLNIDGNTKQCMKPLNLGEDCSKLGGQACKSHFCADGRCCESACDQTCEACDKYGRCMPVKDGADLDTCFGSKACNSDGECKIQNGEECTPDDSCVTEQNPNCPNPDCINGLCKQDYTGDKWFCGPLYSCVHDHRVYSGDEAAIRCKNERYSRKCDGNSGKWVDVDCGVNTCVQQDNGRLVYHERGCIDGSGKAVCFDRTPDPDSSEEACHTCFSPDIAEHWIGKKCCGDDPGEDFDPASANSSCCYNAGLVPSGIPVSVDGGRDNLLCKDGILYVCGKKLSDCSTSVCLPMDNCKQEGDKICCNGQWQDACAVCK